MHEQGTHTEAMEVKGTVHFNHMKKIDGDRFQGTQNKLDPDVKTVMKIEQVEPNHF